MPKRDEVKSTSKGRGKAEKKKVGRPSSYMQEVADDICMLLAQEESLRKICERPSMPNKSTVIRWLKENPEFCDQYARAREMQADSLLDEMLDIADCATPENVSVAKLRVDSRKWYITKVAPKKYGDRITQEISGTVTNQNIELTRSEFADLAKELLNEV